MTFTEHDVTVMHTELAALRDRVNKRILVSKIAASHKVEQMRHLRLLERVGACKREDGFDIERNSCEAAQDLGRVCSVDNPEHSEIEIFLTRDGRPHLKNLQKTCGQR